MPLIKSSSPGALKANISTLMGEIGKSPHVQSRKQALAIAFSNQRRSKRWQGGSVDPVLLAGGKDSKALRKRPANPDKYADGGRISTPDDDAGTDLFRTLHRMHAARNFAQDIPESESGHLADQFAQSLAGHEPPAQAPVKDDDYNARVQAAVQEGLQMQIGSRHGFQHGGVPILHSILGRHRRFQAGGAAMPVVNDLSKGSPGMGSSFLSGYGAGLGQPQMDAAGLAGGLAPTAALSEGRFPRMGYPAGGAGMQEGGPVEDSPLAGDLGQVRDIPPAPQTSIDMDNPFERAAFRMRGHVSPKGPEYEEGMQNLATIAGLVSPVGRVASLPAAALQAGVRYAPKIAAGLGGLYGLMAGMDPASEAEAVGVKLTRQQQQEQAMRDAETQRQLEVQRQKDAAAAAAAQAEREGKAAEAKAAREDAARADREAKELAEKIRREQEDRAAAAVVAERQRMATAGFREKYPSLANAAMGLGTAASFAIPYGGAIKQDIKNIILNRAWRRTAAEAEGALKAGDMASARTLGKQLAGYENQSAAMNAGPESLMGSGFWDTTKRLARAAPRGVSSALIAGAPGEFGMAPELADLVAGSPEAKEKARGQVFDWGRIVPATLMGAAGFTTGRHTPTPFISVSPQGRGRGIIDEIAAREKEARAAAKAAKAAKEAAKQNIPGRALGGALPFYERQGMYALAKEGMMASTSPGRGDKIPTAVRSGSYVIPADVVSGKGQGNSLAGASKFGKMFSQAPMGGAGGAAMRQGPMGTAIPAVKKITKPMFSGARMPKLRTRAAGGPIGHPTPVALSGGEYIVGPEKVAHYGKGDINRGHDRLDRLVHNIRKKTIHQMRKLPGPKKK